MFRRREERRYALPPADGDRSAPALHALWPLGRETFRILLSAAPQRVGRSVGAGDVDMDVPPEAVWPWLAQMMRGGGMYGWPRLETPACRSANVLLDGIPSPAEGDRVGTVLELATVTPLREMVWRGCEPIIVLGLAVGGIEIHYRLEARPDHKSRLSARTRLAEHQLTRPLRVHLRGVIEFVLPFHQLSRIARLAESGPGSGNSARARGRHQTLPLQPASTRPSRRA